MLGATFIHSMDPTLCRQKEFVHSLNLFQHRKITGISPTRVGGNDSNGTFALYSTFNEGKAVVIERFHCTLKERLYKKFTQLGSQQWLSIIQDIVDKYNDTIHTSTKTKPS